MILVEKDPIDPVDPLGTKPYMCWAKWWLRQKAGSHLNPSRDIKPLSRVPQETFLRVRDIRGSGVLGFEASDLEVQGLGVLSLTFSYLPCDPDKIMNPAARTRNISSPKPNTPKPRRPKVHSITSCTGCWRTRQGSPWPQGKRNHQYGSGFRESSDLLEPVCLGLCLRSGGYPKLLKPSSRRSPKSPNYCRLRRLGRLRFRANCGLGPT